MWNRPCLGLLLAIFIALALASGQGSAQSPLGMVGLKLRADPERVLADGETQVIISLEVYDTAGQPVSDGTLVHFSTTLGEIQTPIATLGGMAQTALTPSQVAGTAIVSAIVGASRQTVEVEFLAQPGSSTPGSRMVELTANELSYSADRRFFVASWKANLTYQNITIQADGLQYDIASSAVRAQGNVTIKSGDHFLQADALRYELMQKRGRLLRISDPIERLLVEGDRLATREDKSLEMALWGPMPSEETRTWIKAKRAIIDPGKRIILDQATFFVDDNRLMALRRYVMNPSAGTPVFGRALGFSSVGGMSLDFPWYYRASAHNIGSLHFTSNALTSGGRYQTGWALGLREEYIRAGRSEGALSLDDVFNPKRSIRWEHHHKWGDGARMELTLNSLNYGGDSPSLRSGLVGYSRPLGDGRVSLLLSDSIFGESQQSFAELSYRFTSLRAGPGILITPGLRVRQSRTQNEDQDIIINTDTGEPIQFIRQNSSGRTEGVDVNFSLPTRKLSGSTSITASLNTGYSRGFSFGSRTTLDGRLTLTTRFKSTQYATLTYNYSGGSDQFESILRAPGHHLLNLNASLKLKNFPIQLNASKELDGSRAFGSFRVSRALPFGTDVLGRPLWSLEASYFFSQLESYKISNTRLSVNRTIGRYLASLSYSPQGASSYGSRPWLNSSGYGYRYTGGGKFWIELRARQF